MEIKSGKLAAMEKSQLAKDFVQIDRRDLAKKTDKELSEWQAKYELNTAQHILAGYEWQRRLTAEQVKASRFATVASVISALAGAVLGAFLQHYFK